MLFLCRDSFFFWRGLRVCGCLGCSGVRLRGVWDIASLRSIYGAVSPRDI